LENGIDDPVHTLDVDEADHGPGTASDFHEAALNDVGGALEMLADRGYFRYWRVSLLFSGFGFRSRSKNQLTPSSFLHNGSYVTSEQSNLTTPT